MRRSGRTARNHRHARATATPPGGPRTRVVHTFPVVETLDDGTSIARAGRLTVPRLTPPGVDLA